MAGKLVVYGIFDKRDQVEKAVESLRNEGFTAEDVSVLFPTPDTVREFAHTKESKAPEGASFAGSAGAVLGGALGWLVGLGAVSIPGLGSVVAAGPLIGLLAGSGAGGVIGGVAGALIGLGLPEYEARRYEGRVQEGGILLSVHCDSKFWRGKAMEVLKRWGSHDVSASEELPGDIEVSEPKREAGKDISAAP
jgi:hypothetical protein